MRLWSYGLWTLVLGIRLLTNYDYSRMRPLAYFNLNQGRQIYRS
jgi:hypothetical protein